MAKSNNQPTGVRGKILEVLEKGAFTRKELAKECGCNEGTLDKALKFLVNEGRIEWNIKNLAEKRRPEGMMFLACLPPQKVRVYRLCDRKDKTA